jgi:Acetyltransferase (GNAT) domain
VIGLAAEGKVWLNRILVDGTAIAAAIVLRSGRQAWFWKIAYDEGFARFSPGVMLSVALTDELLEEPTVERIDSCATADHPMIDHLWRERLATGDRLVAVRPAARFRLAKSLERLRSAAITGVKKMSISLRSRRR